MVIRFRSQLIAAVMLPIVVSVGLLIWLNAIQEKAEASMRTAEKYSLTLRALGDVDSAIYEVLENFYAAKLDAFNWIQLMHSVKQAVRRTDEAVASLRIYVVDNPKAQADLVRLMDLRQSIVKLVHDGAANIQNGSFSLEKRTELAHGTSLLGRQAIATIPVLEKDVLDSAQQQYSQGFRYKTQERWIIGSLCLLNFVLAALAALSLSNDASSRLNRLKKNVALYEQGQPLMPPPSGSNEISDVERAFFDTAIQLRGAQQRQKDLVSMFTHDLRNPLTAVAMGLDKLVVSEAQEVRSTSAEKTKKNIAIMSELITDLLDLYKVESNDFEFSQEPVDLNALLAEAVKQMEPFAEQLGIGLRNESGPAPLMAKADAKVCLRIFHNLIGNAIKHSPTESTITVSCTSRDKFICARVADQGPGIPAAEQDLVFQRFQQGTTSKKSRLAGLGSGLGLSLCKTFAEGQKGTLTLVSAENKGAEFTLRLPAV